MVSGCRDDACTLNGTKVARGLIAWVGLGQGDVAPPRARDPLKDEVHLLDGRVVTGEFEGLSLGGVAIADQSFDRDEVAWIHFAGPEPAPTPRPSPAGPYYRFSPSPPASSPLPSPPPTPPPSTPPPGASPSPPPPPGPGTGALWTGIIRGRYWGTVGEVTTEMLVTVDVKLRETAPTPLTAPGAATVIGQRVDLDPAGSTITNTMTASSPDVSCRGSGTATHPGNTAERSDGLLMTRTRNGDTRGLAGIDIPLGRTLYSVAYLHTVDEFTFVCTSRGVTESSKIGYTVPPLGRAGIIAYEHNGDPEFRFVQGTGKMVGSYQAPSVIAFQQMSAEWSICREGTNCAPPRQPGPSASPSPSPDPCGTLAQARAQVDVLWDQRQLYAGELKDEWDALEQAHGEMLDNVDAYKAAIPLCAIWDIVSETLESASGWAGEFTEFGTKILNGDLSASVGAEPWKSLSERAWDVFPRQSTWAGLMRDRITGCGAPISPEMRAAALRFVDSWERVRRLMPAVQEKINRIRTQDQKYWDEWNKYYRECQRYARCKGLPAPPCPPPPESPSGPMPPH